MNGMNATSRSHEAEETFVQNVLSDIELGIWSFELDEGCPPRMYGNAAMDKLVGCDGSAITPEEYYNTWYGRIDPHHLSAVQEVVKRIIAGEFAEVHYPYHHPTRGVMQVICGGRRDMTYTKGIRLVGRHQDVSALIKVTAEEIARAERQHCINASLEILLRESNLRTALERIMVSWCESLGAQWCYLGEYRNGMYVPVYSCAVKGETPLYDENDMAEISTALYNRGTSDFLAMPDFQKHPLCEMLTAVSPHPGLMRQVSSCYSYLIRRNGQIWGSLVLSFRNRRVLTPAEVDFFVSLAKSTELALERSLRLTELAAERDHALEAERARGLFFSSVSHDIRTPLNAIVGFSELLEGGVTDKADHDRYVSTIRSSGKVLARLVNDILDLSKLESGKLEIIPEPTDVPTLAREVAESFGVVRARKSIFFNAEIAPMPLVSIDPQRVRQLLYNLLSNAYKYTDAGRITLRTTWSDGELTISVSDTGKGISKDNLTRILQPFVQIVDRNHRDGTGLGLSICQKLVQLMNGELTVTSEVGMGSTFTIVFHRVEVVSAETAQADSAAAKPGGEKVHCIDRTKRVLIVDDSPVNRAVLKAMLAKNGVADIVAAENGAEALKLLQSDPSIAAVLTDLWMPVIDGEGLVTAIRADPELRNLPVYLITADVESVRVNHDNGFTGILLKPLTQTVVRSLLI